ncbi:MAG: glycosyltransferase family 4 protein [Lysobacter sp.]
MNHEFSGARGMMGDVDKVAMSTVDVEPMAQSIRPARVLMVLEGPYPTARGGGAEAQVRTLTGAMRARGQRVTIVAPLNPDGPQASISRVDGVPVCRLRFPRLRFLGGPVLWLVLAGFLIARRRHYNVWHVHVARSWAVVCALLARALGKRLVIKVSGSWDLEHGALAPNSGLLGRLPHLCLLRADGWQAISQRIATTLQTRGIPPARIVAIPNAVDTRRFRHVSHPSGADARFIFIGRLVEEKGIPTLLEAFSDIIATYPGARLLIVGTGPLLDTLTFRAATLGVDHAVTFAGHRDDVETVLAEANFGVLPSRFEGLSNALLECMASGLPMVASRISGNEDFVRTGENGWMFEPGDRAGLARCLAAAAALPPEDRSAMGEYARATVTRKAGIDKVLDGMVALYAGDESGVSTINMSERRA